MNTSACRDGKHKECDHKFTIGRSVEKCTCFCHVAPDDVEKLYNDIQAFLLVCSVHGNNVINGSAESHSLGNTINKIERATRDISGNQSYDDGH